MTLYRFGVAQAAAWRIVAELSRRHAASHPLSLLEMHPGISAAGMLRLMLGVPSPAAPSPQAVTFSFGGQAGTCDVTRSDAPVWADFDYVTPMLVGDPKSVVDRLESALGLTAPPRLPPSSAWVLCTRLIADILSREWLARQPLRTTSGWVDASVGSTVPAWTALLGADGAALREALACGAMAWQDAFSRTGHFIAVHPSHEGSPMIEPDRKFAALDMTTGVLVFGGPGIQGTELSIPKRYVADGRRLGRIVDDVLMHLER